MQASFAGDYGWQNPAAEISFKFAVI
jgi:hypothetical protein